MHDIVTSFFFSLVTGIVASIFSTIFIYMMKPRVEISPIIAKQTDTKGNYFYGIKVINKGRCAIKNIDVTWEILIPKSVPGGVRYEFIPIELRKVVKYIDGKNRKNRNMYIYNTKENVEEMWTDTINWQISFRMYCEHAIFSTGKQFVKIYYHKPTDIVEGVFKAGNSLEIV